MTAEALGSADDFTDRGQALWGVLREHYEADPELESAHRDVLQGQLRTRFPRLGNDFDAMLGGLDPSPPVENLIDLLVSSRQSALEREMAVALVEGQSSLFETLLSTYRACEGLDLTTDTLVGVDPTELLAVVEAGNRIPILPAHLSPHIRGGLLPGHNCLIYGRPEIGKSALALNCARHASEADFRVGYWENEDPIVTTQLRMVQAICNATEEQVRVHGGRYRSVLEAAGYYDRIFFRESPDGSIAEIEAWVEQNQLDLVIINQMVNLRTQGDNRVLELSNIARGQRALAKRQGCAVIGVAQAGESAIGRSILRLQDLEWSNTGVQATLDLMLGVSALEAHPMQRTLSLCKNKLAGNHDTLVLNFDPQRSRVE